VVVKKLMTMLAVAVLGWIWRRKWLLHKQSCGRWGC
jgi:hypothetical protein